MTKEYIEREKAIKEAIAERDLHSPFTPELSGWRVGAEKVANRLASIPTADVEEVRHGQWKLHDNGDGTCSRCGIYQKHIWDMDGWQNFCGHCGADMRDGRRDE